MRQHAARNQDNAIAGISPHVHCPVNILETIRIKRNRMSDILKESSNPDIIATLAHSN